MVSNMMLITLRTEHTTVAAVTMMVTPQALMSWSMMVRTIQMATQRLVMMLSKLWTSTQIRLATTTGLLIRMRMRTRMTNLRLALLLTMMRMLQTLVMLMLRWMLMRTMTMMITMMVMTMMMRMLALMLLMTRPGIAQTTYEEDDYGIGADADTIIMLRLMC